MAALVEGELKKKRKDCLTIISLQTPCTSMLVNMVSHCNNSCVSSMFRFRATNDPTNATTDASVPGNPVFRQLQYIYGEVRTLHYTPLACLVSEYGNIGCQQR